MSKYARYPDVVTEADVSEMISKQRSLEAKRRGGPAELTPYAIRCHKHGRAVLTFSEAGDAMCGATQAKCPYCVPERECKIDSFWYEHTKERLFGL